MADEVTIKLAQSTDAAAVLRFLREAATESDAVLIPHLQDVSVDQEAHNIDLINTFDDCVMLLAVLGEEIVGLVTIMVLADQPTTGELGVVVRKKYWRNGIGQLLVDEAEYWFDHYSSLETLILSVFQENLPAIKLYQKMNFVQTGAADEEGHHAIQMKYVKEEKEWKATGDFFTLFIFY